MSAIDGRFDKELDLEDLSRNVVAAGFLDIGFKDLDVTLHCVVIDKEGVVAEGEEKSPRLVEVTPEPPNTKPEKVTWAFKVPAPAAMHAGPGIAYATALGTGPEGIKSWQWHSVVELEV